MTETARDDVLPSPPSSVVVPAPADATSAEKPSSALRSGLEWILIIAGALLAAFVIKTFLFQAFYIPSGSMEPTLQIGDRVLVNKLSYRFGEIDRGDLVVFSRPDLAPGTEAAVRDLIKRVIALPGETVESRDGRIFVDGEAIDEPYLPRGTLSDNVPKQVVPEGRVWVMGDNRSNSRDSRVIGTIDVETIHGKAFVRIWPLPDFGLF